MEGEYELAQKYYLRTFELSVRLGDLTGYSESLISLGGLHEVRLDFGAALSAYTQALDISKAGYNENLDHRIRLSLAELLTFLGAAHEAWTLLEPTLAFYQGTQDPFAFPKAVCVYFRLFKGEKKNEAKIEGLLDEVLQMPGIYPQSKANRHFVPG